MVYNSQTSEISRMEINTGAVSCLNCTTIIQFDMNCRDPLKGHVEEYTNIVNLEYWTV